MSMYEEFLSDQKRTEKLLAELEDMTKVAGSEHYQLEDLEARLGLLEGYWRAYVERDFTLQRVSETYAQRTYFKAEVFQDTQLKYLRIKAWFAKRIRDSQVPQQAPIPASTRTTTSNAMPTQAALEKIRLPTFDGKQRDWEVFKEKFNSLVTNDATMDPVIKLQHLSNCLNGEAAGKLKGIQMIGANFQTAWDTLCHRYDNKYLRLSFQMQALVKLPSATVESEQHLGQLLNTVNESVNVFTTLERPVDKWDDFLVFFVDSKLAPSTRLEWKKEIERSPNTTYPKYSEIKAFLEERIRTLDLVDIDQDHASGDGSRGEQAPAENYNRAKREWNKQSHGQRKSKSVGSYTATQQTARQGGRTQCTFCQGDHFVGYCKKFTSASVEQRRVHASTKQLCFNCLSTSHTVSQCVSKGRCVVCGCKHHTKLHLEGSTTAATATADTAEPNSTVAHIVNETSHHGNISDTRTLLSTACAIIQADNGQAVTVRVLLDSGAEESFITEYIVKLLALPKQAAHVAVSGVGGTRTAVAKARVTAILKSKQDANFQLPFSALVLQRLTSILPRAAVAIKDRDYLKDTKLADPHFDTPAGIDCVLSSAVYAALLRPGIRRGAPAQPVALNSALGWVLMGPVDDAVPERESRVASFHLAVDHSLSDALTKFWEVEQPTSSPHLTPDDEECYNHFRRTVTRDAEGRFVLRLPFAERPELAGTRALAEGCLKRVEKRFDLQPELAAAYRNFMTEYQDLGHMELVVNTEEINSEAVYLPHHAVWGHASRKIRVVFNASQKDAVGRSLNSFMRVGPKLQEDVLILMVRWSFLPIVFTCDIVKMFRQFLVHPGDRDFQRIVWRVSTAEPIRSYRLTTVTYGTASAPFLSNACMLKLADDEQHQFPLAAEALRKNRYADDFFVGGDTMEEARILREQLVQILKSAGMTVGKWAANRAELLCDLEEQKVEKRGTAVQDPEIVSALGLQWLPNEDAFCLRVADVSTTDRVTKRSILSEIAKLYDPIGWLAPVVVIAKIIMQTLWLQGANWDEAVSSELKNAWVTFQMQLKDLEKLRIPRWNGAVKGSVWQLHGFCDASERAYAAAIYAVILEEDRVISAKLLAAKARVAPIKSISLPKLELCGASLLCKLITAIKSKLDNPPEEIYCWSDSKVVLAWLHAHPSRWKAFIANRVSEIITLLPHANWNHVRSEENPADLATRGITPLQLRESPIWWSGPAWLRLPASGWPISSEQSFQTTEEARRGTTSTIHVAQGSDLSEWMAAFSSYDKIVRILAYILRWRANAKSKPCDRRLTWFSAAELARGRVLLHRLVQMSTFGPEIQRLRESDVVSRTSSISRLSPFLDHQGLLRVGGRLQNAFLTDSEKHPTILPARHWITTLLIRRAHILTLHGGPSVVQSHLLRQFWIVRGRNEIRKLVRECVRCTRYKAVTLEQQMGPLPAVRVQPNRPFTITGVDFAGPFLMRCSAGRGQKAFKGYVAVFVCMVVRAVHLEVVSDLTSAAFLAAFRRFVARRGLCHVMYSDHGTNFQGAQAELRRLFTRTSAMSQEIAETVAKDGVDWTFIPPRAPNFGGLWEANVKSFKTHLSRVIGEARLTFEEFYTLTSMIEACLNSRPLSSLHSTEEDVAALTPGHFLIGAALTAPPEPFEETDEGQTVSSRWHMLSLMRNHFWKRWSQECLTQLQRRAKWLNPNHSFREGNVVLFKDGLLPPTKWPLARIVKLYTGKDGLCRVARIKTATAEYKRPINKLILLPVNNEAVAYLSAIQPSV